MDNKVAIDIMTYPEGFDYLLDEAGHKEMPPATRQATFLALLMALLVD